MPPASDTLFCARDRSLTAETLRGSVHESPVRHVPDAHKRSRAPLKRAANNWVAGWGRMRVPDQEITRQPPNKHHCLADQWAHYSCASTILSHDGSQSVEASNRSAAFPISTFFISDIRSVASPLTRSLRSEVANENVRQRAVVLSLVVGGCMLLALILHCLITCTLQIACYCGFRGLLRFGLRFFVRGPNKTAFDPDGAIVIEDHESTAARKVLFRLASGRSISVSSSRTVRLHHQESHRPSGTVRSDVEFRL